MFIEVRPTSLHIRLTMFVASYGDVLELWGSGALAKAGFPSPGLLGALTSSGGVQVFWCLVDGA